MTGPPLSPLQLLETGDAASKCEANTRSTVRVADWSTSGKANGVSPQPAIATRSPGTTSAKGSAAGATSASAASCRSATSCAGENSPGSYSGCTWTPTTPMNRLVLKSVDPTPTAAVPGPGSPARSLTQWAAVITHRGPITVAVHHSLPGSARNAANGQSRANVSSETAVPPTIIAGPEGDGWSVFGSIGGAV